MHPYVDYSIILSGLDMKAAQVFADGGTDAEEVVMYAVECDSPMEANGFLLPAVVWVDLEGVVLGEVSQTERERYRVISLMCGMWKAGKNCQRICGEI